MISSYEKWYHQTWFIVIIKRFFDSLAYNNIEKIKLHHTHLCKTKLKVFRILNFAI